MHDSVLSLVVILLATAVVTVVLFRRLNMPAILGYLIVGVAIGPHALGIVPDNEGTRYLAEFGVVFLMFSIGLEFSLPQLMAMRRIVLGLGGSMVLVNLVTVMAIAMLAGQSWQTAFILGGAISMSSTAIISKLLVDQSQLHTPHGKQTIGVLLFQDLAVIPFIVLVPVLTLSGEAMANAVALALFKAAVVLTLILFVGQRLMRPLFHLVAAQKSSELFVLTVLLVTLGLSLATEVAGLSLALGAFLAGMLIAETEYRYQVEDDIKPFRDVLLGLFFITIGMLLNFKVLREQLLMVLLVLLAMATIKFFIVFALASFFKSDRAVALRVALALAPAGEFGFVMLAVAEKNAALPTNVLQVVLAASIISMLLSPFVLKYTEKVVLYFVASEWEARAVQLQQLAVQSMMKKNHVIIAGYGRSGQGLARFLEREKISFTALDPDPVRVKAASAAGESVLFGDASKREVLMAAGITRASALVVSFADTHTAKKIIAHARDIKPDLPVIVRTFDDSDVEALRQAGADEIVAEVVEGSLMLATQTMLLLGIPLNRVLARLRSVRGERYQLMRGFFPGATDEDDGALDPEQPRLQSIVVDAGAAAVGKRVADVDIGRAGVFLMALRRGNVRYTDPDPELRVQAGDVLILNGSPESLARAEMLVMQG
jgi:CPA2 family monovalent cation:H+ antiporter-2